MRYRFLSILWLLMAACHSSKQPVAKGHSKTTNPSTAMQPTFDKQGHRGCRGLLPENTIPAMLKALELGVTTLEMDVVITADRQPLLSHEPFFNHEITTLPNGQFVGEAEERSLNIYKMTYDEIRRYDVGMKPHPRFAQQQKIRVGKPRLAALFDSVAHYMKTAKRPYPYFNIETKCLPATDNIYHPEPGKFVDILMKVIKEKGMEGYVTIQSFDFRTLQYLHKQYPGIKTAMLVEDNDKAPFEEQLKKLGFDATVYSPHHSLVTASLVQKCHQRNMLLIPWTVNDRATMERLKALGVDGIISDYPNLFE
jgi:glycerophosphoryl diester phosphodiesterase